MEGMTGVEPTRPGLANHAGDHPPTRNKHLLRWVEKMAELACPSSIHWVDGSQEEYDRLCEQLIANGTFIRLNQQRRPGCFYARSDPGDVDWRTPDWRK